MPRHVAACRCGTAVDWPEGASSSEAEPTVRRSRSTLAAIAVPLAFTLAAVGGYYYFGPVATDGEVTRRTSLGPPPQRNDGYLDPMVLPAPKIARNESSPPPAVIPTPQSSAQRPDPETREIEDVVTQVLPAIVQIQATGVTGTGFFVAYDTLITNLHVVKEGVYVTIKTSDGTTTTARVERRAPSYDLALLKVVQPSPSQTFIPLGTARTLRAGQQVIAIGSALGTLQNTVTRGVVSALRSSGGATLVQSDAAINPGNSGGPLLDRQGRAIGVNTMTDTDKPGISFAVASEHVSELLAGRLVDDGTMQRGLDDVQAESRLPESVRQTRQGEKQFRDRLDQLATKALDLDSAWKLFRDQCYHSPVKGAYTREWFAMFSPVGMPANAGQGCSGVYAVLKTDTNQFREQMKKTVAEARRANVLPGTIRDELRNNRLDFDWDR